MKAANVGTPRGGGGDGDKGRLGSGNVFDLLEDLPRTLLDRLYGLETHPLTAAAEAAEKSKLTITLKKPGTPTAVAGGRGPHPWTCRAVFQSLPPLAKQYVMRMICMDQMLSRGHVMAQWVLPDRETKAIHEAALQKLDGLRILVSDVNDAVR